MTETSDFLRFEQVTKKFPDQDGDEIARNFLAAVAIAAGLMEA